MLVQMRNQVYREMNPENVNLANLDTDESLLLKTDSGSIYIIESVEGRPFIYKPGEKSGVYLDSTLEISVGQPIRNDESSFSTTALKKIEIFPASSKLFADSWQQIERISLETIPAGVVVAFKTKTDAVYAITIEDGKLTMRRSEDENKGLYSASKLSIKASTPVLSVGLNIEYFGEGDEPDKVRYHTSTVQGIMVMKKPKAD